MFQSLLTTRALPDFEGIGGMREGIIFFSPSASVVEAFPGRDHNFLISSYSMSYRLSQTLAALG